MRIIGERLKTVALRLSREHIVGVYLTKIGRIACENLVARMAGETRVRVTEIPAELSVRGSAAPPSLTSRD